MEGSDGAVILGTTSYLMVWNWTNRQTRELHGNEMRVVYHDAYVTIVIERNARLLCAANCIVLYC